jgi:hypothetical protein
MSLIKEDVKLKLPNIKLSKVLVADIEVFASAFFFGIGFLGQRAVSVDGLGDYLLYIVIY